jgi:hypothetical protein
MQKFNREDKKESHECLFAKALMSEVDDSYGKKMRLPCRI